MPDNFWHIYQNSSVIGKQLKSLGVNIEGGKINLQMGRM